MTDKLSSKLPTGWELSKHFNRDRTIRRAYELRAGGRLVAIFFKRRLPSVSAVGRLTWFEGWEAILITFAERWACKTLNQAINEALIFLCDGTSKSEFWPGDADWKNIVGS